MSANPQQLQPKAPPTKAEQPVPEKSKTQEIENLKRLLANVSQRLDKLK